MIAITILIGLLMWVVLPLMIVIVLYCDFRKIKKVHEKNNILLTFLLDNNL